MYGLISNLLCDFIDWVYMVILVALPIPTFSTSGDVLSTQYVQLNVFLQEKYWDILDLLVFWPFWPSLLKFTSM